MSKLIEQLVDEYNEMPDDGSWDPLHPIFQMAQHIDQLKADLHRLANHAAIVELDLRDNLDSADRSYESFRGLPDHLQLVINTHAEMADTLEQDT